MSGPLKPWEGRPLEQALASMVENAGYCRFGVAAKENQADIVILLESNQYKDWRYLKLLASEETFCRRPNDCFTLNYEDDAVGFLPGLYAGLPDERFDVVRHRASCYLLPPNLLVEDFAVKRDVTPAWLLSFRGASSYHLREQIFSKADEWLHLGPICRMNRWFDHTEEEKRIYFQEILNSKFVLCPRGIAPTSHRLFEVMQMGRVPVILADAWMPPEGPDWSSFSIRISESRLSDVPEILASRVNEWSEMAENARSAWETFFSPEKKIVHALRLIEDIGNRRPHGYSEKEVFSEWFSMRRQWTMGWTIPQRGVRYLKRLSGWYR